MERGISVVIPTYNRARVIIPLLECLDRMKYRKYEVVIVNDGSSDETAEVVSAFIKGRRKFRLVNQRNKGPAGARNTGIRQSRFGIVAFTDDDCRPPSDWLARINRYFSENPEIIGVGGIMFTPEDQIKVLTHHAPPLRVAERTQARFPGTNNVAYRKKSLERINGFDEKFRQVSTEDVDLYIRIRRLGRVIFDTALAMPHISRPISLKQAIKGYKSFYLGFKAIERKYPEEFREVYGQASTESRLGHESGLSIIRSHLRYYFPEILNPVTFIRALYYYAATRLFLLRMRFGKSL